jgi:hypothetical protein
MPTRTVVMTNELMPFMEDPHPFYGLYAVHLRRKPPALKLRKQFAIRLALAQSKADFERVGSVESWRRGHWRIASEEAVGDVINLNKVRKAREKAAASATAQTNRAKHGRTKTEREIEKILTEKAEGTLTAHKRVKSIEKDDKD